jgi:lysozyme
MNKDKLHSDVAAAEGLRLYAYKDSLGFWTGGYGHLLDQTKNWHGVMFTQDQCDLWLAGDLVIATSEAAELLEWASLDTDARQNAVVELVFNMGEDHWRKFVHTRMFITQKKWALAHDGLLDSLWAKEVGPHRSGRIAMYLLSGEF